MPPGTQLVISFCFPRPTALVALDTLGALTMRRLKLHDNLSVFLTSYRESRRLLHEITFEDVEICCWRWGGCLELRR